MTRLFIITYPDVRLRNWARDAYPGVTCIRNRTGILLFCNFRNATRHHVQFDFAAEIAMISAITISSYPYNREQVNKKSDPGSDPCHMVWSQRIKAKLIQSNLSNLTPVNILTLKLTYTSN